VCQFDVAVGFHGLHEGIGDADRDVEVGQVAGILGVDEFLDVRMVAAQHAHLGATAGAGGLDGFAGAVEDAHVRHRAGGARLGTLDAGALRTDGREVIADAATATHGFGGLGQRGVDARLAIGVLDDGVADRLHEAVDQRRLQVGTGGGVDAAGRDETVFLGPQELGFPVGAVGFLLDLGQRVGNAATHVMDVGFLALGVFFDQHFAGNFLLWQRRKLGWRGNIGQRQLLGDFAHRWLLIDLRLFRLLVFECCKATRYSGRRQYLD